MAALQKFRPRRGKQQPAQKKAALQERINFQLRRLNAPPRRCHK